MNKITLNLKNPITNEIITASTGFSWTTLLFGFLVPLYRRDWKAFFLFTPIYFITFGMASIPFAFFYNKRYIRSLFEQGCNLLYFTGELKSGELDELVGCPTIERKMQQENITQKLAA
ncbi:MAG: hypothetical protein ACK5N8_00245 [Alphaproteobacteria bacterium]